MQHDQTLSCKEKRAHHPSILKDGTLVTANKPLCLQLKRANIALYIGKHEQLSV